jgi:hypothetical protein
LQAIEKTDVSTNWVTIIFMILLLCVFLLKGFHRTKLKEYFFAFFNKGFIVSEIEERASFFNRFSFTLFFFTTLNFAVLSFFLINYFSQQTLFYSAFFWKTLLAVFCYFSVKWTLEKLFVILFSIQTQTISFLTAKKIYTYTLSLWAFPALILFFYTELNKNIIFIFIGLLFAIKVLLLLANNKNLVLREFFYIILYLCVFEIVPLFILFKLIF